MLDHYRIYDHFDGDFFDKTSAPTEINYVSGLATRLYPIITFLKGRISVVEYFASATLDAQGNEVGTDLVVREDYTYTVDAAGFARARDLVITWVLNDETDGESKTRKKLYNNAASRTEGRRRRRNVMDELSIDVVGMLAMALTAGDVSAAVSLSTPWMAALDTEVQSFLELSSPTLSDAITADAVTTWLDLEIAPSVTIRGYILAALS